MNTESIYRSDEFNDLEILLLLSMLETAHLKYYDKWDIFADEILAMDFDQIMVKIKK